MQNKQSVKPPNNDTKINKFGQEIHIKKSEVYQEYDPIRVKSRDDLIKKLVRVCEHHNDYELARELLKLRE